jgi:hypothetical protein
VANLQLAYAQAVSQSPSEAKDESDGDEAAG